MPGASPIKQAGLICWRFETTKTALLKIGNNSFVGSFGFVFRVMLSDLGAEEKIKLALQYFGGK